MSLTKGDTGRALRFGCVGIRGYGGVVCDLLAQHHTTPGDGIRFVAACDPAPDQCTDKVNKLRGLGVDIVPDAATLLALDLDAVWLPLPIHMHSEYTVAALESGKAVICEKPAAGCVEEVDAMIRAQKKTGLPVLVGFQHMFDPVMLDIKRDLVGGRYGKIKRAVVYGCWPRTRQYYSRNNWAGRLRMGRSMINDSPASNAMSHFIMLAMFMLGSAEGEAAQVKNVQPYLYRAAKIETYDTISMRIATAEGAEIDVHLSHASRSEITPTVTVQTDTGQMVITEGRNIVVETDNVLKNIPWRDDARHRIAPTLASILRGELDSYLPASLENARQHVLACELATTNGAVIDVSPTILRQGVTHQDGEGTAINDIEVMISECVRNGQLLTTLSKQT